MTKTKAQFTSKMLRDDHKNRIKFYSYKLVLF